MGVFTQTGATHDGRPTYIHTEQVPYSLLLSLTHTHTLSLSATHTLARACACWYPHWDNPPAFKRSL